MAEETENKPLAFMPESFNEEKCQVWYRCSLCELVGRNNLIEHDHLKKHAELVHKVKDYDQYQPDPDADGS